MNHRTLRQQVTRIAAVATAMLLAPVLAFSAPTQVTQQGRLVDDLGDGLTGSHSIEFTLFSDDAGTTAVWSESHTLTLDAGYYSVVLGADSSNVLDSAVLSAEPLYLGMSVDAGALMQPLLEVTSAPYAVMADTTTNLDGGYADASALYIDGTMVIDGNGDWIGSTLPGTLAALGCTDGQGATWTAVSSEWVCTHPGDHYDDTDAVAAMGSLSDNNALNHDRYSDADAVSAMGTASISNTYNHNRYSDSDAISAMGTSGNTNTYNHGRYTNADATAAMGSAGNNNTYNHGRYTDTDAIAAVGPHNTFGSADAVAAMGALNAANALNHTRYQGSEAVTAVAAADNYVLNTGDDVINGNLTVGTSTTSVGRSLTVTTNANNIADLGVYGTGQGSGRIYVGQSSAHGGGMSYDGDGSPAMVGANDDIVFFRRDTGVDSEVFSYHYNSSTVDFAGTINVGNDVVVTDDLSVGDQLTVGDDASVGGTLSVTGNVDADGHVYGNRYAFSAYANGLTAHPSTSIYTVTFSDKHDPYNRFSSTNNWFTAPKAGLYYFSTSISTYNGGNSSPDHVYLYLSKNGSNSTSNIYGRIKFEAENTSDGANGSSLVGASVATSAVIPLNLNDTVRVRLSSINSGASWGVYDRAFNGFYLGE
jgi:hypothetical protein